MKRLVEPEILDTLPSDDPRAIASRVDLRRINFVMGNERWILREVAKHPQAAAKGIVEWGAGEGCLLERMSRFGPATGVDLVPRPDGLPDAIDWQSGDVMKAAGMRGGILVANLFLHHFEANALRELGRRMSGFDVVIAVEPWRSPGSLALGFSMQPLVTRVTRHDMLASIRAGFARRELAGLLGLDAGGWRIGEKASFRGSLRWRAMKKK
ncbi:hypothetical protein [Haloferula helveola]